MSGPFDFVNDILYNKKYIMVDNQKENEYVPFLSNRALSYNIETILYAQEMNIKNGLDKKLQYDYLINSTRPIKRRYSKWAKKIVNSDVDLIQEYFGYNFQNAKIALSILSKEQLKEIKKRLEKGG